MDQPTQTALIDRKKIFEKELNLIKNEDLRVFVIGVLDTVPEYFFHIPASSTGKYHPAYALGEGGLVRHVRAAVWIAQELFNMDTDWTQGMKDTVIAALILHDCMKNGDGKDKYTVTEHPLLMARAIREHVGGAYPDVSDCVETHMGRWVMDFKTGKQVLQPPASRMQKVVHLADYIASRRCLEFNFATLGE